MTPMDFLLAIVVGLLVGSFLNVVILRLPKRMEWQWKTDCAETLGMAAPEGDAPPGIVFKPSHCPKCGTPLALWHNIPVLSYLILRGRCAWCSERISLQYPLVELLAAVLAGLAAFRFGMTWQGVFFAIFAWALLALTVIDLREQLLPDTITIPLLWLGLLVNIQGLFVPLEEAVIGAAAGYLALRAVYELFKLVTGKEGMGFGDFKLLAALGGWLGWKMLFPIILVSSLVGALAGVAIMIFAGHDRRIPIPFGPYLAAAGLILGLYGQELINWYMRISGIA